MALPSLPPALPSASTSLHFARTVANRREIGCKIANLIPSFSEQFFIDLNERVGTEWINQPRHQAITYNNNGFSLVMIANGDTIPWEFVQEMAIRGWELAARGFTDLFDIMYANANGNIMVSVSLRLLDHALPGGDSGTSSQTATGGWREGSVPSVGTGAEAQGWGGGGGGGTR